MILDINNLVPSVLPNRSSRSARSFTSTSICTLETRGIIMKLKHFTTEFAYFTQRSQIHVCGLIQLGIIAYIFIGYMKYHCAKFYVNISTNVDTTHIFQFPAIFHRNFTILPKNGKLWTYSAWHHS